ncbi:MerR family transcriptional regulator [Streptomyces sp. SCSIO 75703]|uniref:MerR family transcriptional regulator n=1 Tax=Streptomyces sp. SCSIO 75703 TaxID=3112165 RepID=UPI0030D0A107
MTEAPGPGAGSAAGPGPRLRTVDLARLAGISAQQVRNHEAAGVLPPARRTDAGYRVFGEAHRHALLAYRALREGCGAGPAARIVRAAHTGEVPRALALVDAAHAALHEERLALAATRRTLAELSGEACGAGAAPSRPGLRIGEVAALLGVRASALRVWEAAGLLAPGRDPATGYRRYGPADVRDARVTHTLRRGRHPVDRIRPVLEEVRREGGGTALREALAAREAALLARGRALLAGAGALDALLGPGDPVT